MEDIWFANDISLFVQKLHQLVWGPPLLLLLIGAGIYLTILLRGLQFRYLFYSIKLMFSKTENRGAKGDISPLQAVMTAMASAVGTGSVVGMSIAVTSGGVGSLFWLWVTSLITMAIKYGESLLAVRYRVVDKRGEMAGGPMYYIEKGLGYKWLAVIFAIFAIVATFGTGNLVQVNSIADALYGVFGIDPRWTGVFFALATGMILTKGIRSIGKIVSIMVPVMALLYISGGLLVIFSFCERVPEALKAIFTTAFTGQAAFGGFLGSTMMMALQMGVARSVFSSEAGLGISSIAAAAAKTNSSGSQALLAMAGSILSTAIICTITVLAISVSGVLGTSTADGSLLNGASLAIAAFEKGLSGGQYIVTFGLVLFAYSTLVAWAYYGEKSVEYLFGERAIAPYRIVYSLLVVPGAVFHLETVWTFADVMNGLMVFPNTIALIMLSRVIQEETKIFIARSHDTQHSHSVAKHG